MNYTEYFRKLTESNILAQRLGLQFETVSGLSGFSETLDANPSAPGFICVSDSSDGTLELGNQPRLRTMRTVYIALRHPYSNPEAREQALVTIREIFRQFVTHLNREKTRLAQNLIYISDKVTVNEIESYFATGTACAYFTITTEQYSNLMYNPGEWQ